MTTTTTNDSASLLLFLLLCCSALTIKGFTPVTIVEGQASRLAHSVRPLFAASSSSKPEITRRSSIIQSAVTAGAFLTVTEIPILPSSAALSDTTADSLDAAARPFRRVPVFAIVGGSSGKPFMILNNQGLATGYFFMDYEGADEVLQSAIKDAASKDLESKEMWSEARITAVPLEFALKLSKARPQSLAQNKNSYRTVYDIIASVPDMDDAARIDKSGIYKERGRVPMFFFDDLTLNTTGKDTASVTPVFFRKNDLFNEWTKQHPESSPSSVKTLFVAELIGSFDDMIANGYGTKIDGRTIVPVASLESKKAAIRCEKLRGDTPAYVKDEMIAVGGK